MTKKQIKKQQQKEEEEDSSENEQSEEESSIDEESSLDGEELNDEFELGDDEEDSSNDDDDDDDDDEDETTKSNQKSNKKKNTDGSDSFSSAITNILSSKIKAHSQKDPILVRTRKKLVKEMVEEKLEVKAKKAIAAERKQKMDKARVRNVFPQIGSNGDEGEDEEDIEKQQARLNQYLEQEKRLKKIGQRGVIKLFNAILAAQRSTSSSTTNTSSNPVNINDTTTTKKSFVNVVEKEAATNVSKEKFLDLIRSGDTL